MSRTSAHLKSGFKLQASLTELESAELVRRHDIAEAVYQFKHALVQDTAYAALLKGDRKVIHRAVAESLILNFPEQLDENAAELAEHYWRAEDWVGAAEFSRRAGTNALHIFAMREALSHFERARSAFQQIPDAAPEAMVDVILGWAQAAYGIRPFADQLEQLKAAEAEARARHDKPRLAQVLYRMGSVQMASGHNLRAEPIFAECFTLADELDDEQMTVLPTYFMGTLSMDRDPRRALTLFERALELARKYQNADVLAAALGTQAMLYARLGEAAQAQGKLRDALEALTDVRSPMTESDVLLYAAWTWLDLGDPARGLEWGQRGVDTALASNNMDCICYGFTCLGFAHLYSQHPQLARDAFQEALRRSRYTGARQVENLAAMGLATSKFFSGDASAVQELENAHEQAQAIGSGFSSAVSAQTLGEIYLEQNDIARASEFLDSASLYYTETGLVPYLERIHSTQQRLERKRDT